MAQTFDRMRHQIIIQKQIDIFPGCVKDDRKRMQVLSDHPGLSTAEAKVVALTLLRCADYAANQNQVVSVESRPVSG